LVGSDGEQIGIKPLPEALAIARSLDLDLVEVADKANPPVCRIMDYGKFKYETAQKAKESRRKSTNVSVKEMKYRPKIGGGDFETKTRKVEKFLDEGHKVKVTIMFRGREVAHPELGKKILDHVAETVAHLARVEAYPRLDGRNMVMVLGPDKKAQAAHAAALKREAEERGELVPDTDETAAATPAVGEEPSTNGAAPAASPDETDSDTDTDTAASADLPTEVAADEADAVTADPATADPASDDPATDEPATTSSDLPTA
jgi:translation initiation factor IF-3